MNNRIQIFSKVEGGKLTRNRVKVQQAIQHFEGKHVVITVERKKSKRSVDQNSYLWGVCYTVVAIALLDFGTPLSKEDVHIMLRMKAGEEIPHIIYDEIVNKETGEIISNRMRSTTEYSTSDMMEYIAFIQRFAAEYLGVVIPDPNEQTEIEYGT